MVLQILKKKFKTHTHTHNKHVVKLIKVGEISTYKSSKHDGE